MSGWTKPLGLVGAAVMGSVGLLALPRAPLAYEAPDLPVISDPDAWVDARRSASVSAGVRPQSLERLVRHQEGRTELAILYIHGFGSGRGEGEAVIDPLAKELGANLYYLRLPGHGASIDDHAQAKAGTYLRQRWTRSPSRERSGIGSWWWALARVVSWLLGWRRPTPRTWTRWCSRRRFISSGPAGWRR